MTARRKRKTMKDRKEQLEKSNLSEEKKASILKSIEASRRAKAAKEII